VLVRGVAAKSQEQVQDVERDWELDYDTEPATMTETCQWVKCIQNKS
jgi:hypothetical protein